MKSSCFKPVQEEDTIDGTLILSKRPEIHPVAAIYCLSGTLHFHSKNATRKVSAIEPELDVNNINQFPFGNHKWCDQSKLSFYVFL